MLKEIIWNNFFKTGSVDAYLLLKELEELDHEKVNEDSQKNMLN